MDNTREKVGLAANRLLQKEYESVDNIELQRAIHKGNDTTESWESQIRECVARGEKEFEDDFYVVVLFRRERLMVNVIRQMFFPRKSCPTPTIDQVVYKYHRNACVLQFLWVVPNRETCEAYRSWAMVPLEHAQLGQFVADFWSGKLFEECLRQNGELQPVA